MSLKNLVAQQNQLIIRQRFEVAEFFGFETRNKYEIHGGDGQLLGFCAEQQKGFLGWLLRQFIGHWRTFSLHFFDAQRGVSIIANHPFRLFFQRLEIFEPDGKRIGALQQRFGILTRIFDIEDSRGQVIMQMRAGLFFFWTFPIFRGDCEVGAVKKRWSGALTELFTDRDNFQVEFSDPSLPPEHKVLLMAAGVFVDLNYFEAKARS